MIQRTMYTAALVTLAALPSFSAGPWSGFYVGWNAGLGQAKAKFEMTPGGNWLIGSEAPGVPWIASQGSPTLSSSEVTTGLQFGYNWQRNRLVYGLEGEIAYTDLQDSRHTGSLVHAPIGAPMQFSEKAESEGFVTLRPRIGVANGIWMVYATGGLALASFRFSSGYVYNFPGLGDIISAGSKRQQMTGWTAGAGVEVVSPGSPVSFKIEYLYMDFGKTHAFTSREPFDPGYTAQHRASLKESLLRFGFNYRFGGSSL